MNSERRESALVVLSGGQDSTTCLYWAKRYYPQVHAISFDYGQRHRVELDRAAYIARQAGVVSHELVKVEGILKGTSPLVNSQFEVEQYKDAASLPGGLEKTFVPMRNTFFLTLALNRAVVLGIKDLVTGVSQEDYGGYPDCRIEFIQAFEHMARQSLEDETIRVLTPLIFKNKKETVLMAQLIGPECMEALAWSHTCYMGGIGPRHAPCGHCHACLLRAKGFEEAGIKDPLIERLEAEANG